MKPRECQAWELLLTGAGGGTNVWGLENRDASSWLLVWASALGWGGRGGIGEDIEEISSLKLHPECPFLGTHSNWQDEL